MYSSVVANDSDPSVGITSRWSSVRMGAMGRRRGDSDRHACGLKALALFPEAASAGFFASCGYGPKIRWVVTRYSLHAKSPGSRISEGR